MAPPHLHLDPKLMITFKNYCVPNIIFKGSIFLKLKKYLLGIFNKEWTYISHWSKVKCLPVLRLNDKKSGCCRTWHGLHFSSGIAPKLLTPNYIGVYQYLSYHRYRFLELYVHIFVASLFSAHYFFNILNIQIQKFPALLCSAYHFSTSANWK